MSPLPDTFSVTVDSFLTTSLEELNGAQAAGWDCEGIVGYVSPVPAPGLIPLYRYYRPDNTDHFYTTDYDSGQAVMSLYGYVYEGIACYIVPADSTIVSFDGTVPLYRYFVSDERSFHTYSTALTPGMERIEGRIWTAEQNLCSIKVEYPNGWERQRQFMAWGHRRGRCNSNNRGPWPHNAALALRGGKPGSHRRLESGHQGNIY